MSLPGHRQQCCKGYEEQRRLLGLVLSKEDIGSFAVAKGYL